MKKYRIIFFGTPDFAVPVLSALQKNFRVVGVVTTPDKSIGRHRTLTQTSVAEFAQKHHLPAFKPDKLLSDVAQSIKSLSPDLFVVAAYGKIIPEKLLNIPRYGALNIHPSLLPKYRGPSPIQSAILNGDEISGVTIIKMDEKMDHGPVVATKTITLSNKDTFETLSNKMFTEGAKLLVNIIPNFINGKITQMEQDDAIASYCSTITKEDGYFDISNPPSPIQLDRIVRAYYPWPTAWIKWSFSKDQDEKGKIVKFLPGNIIQMEGKKPTLLEDFLRGYPDFPIKQTTLTFKNN